LIGVTATNDNAERSYSEATELLSQRADVLLTPPLGQNTLDESVYFAMRRAGLSQSLAVVSGKISSKNGQFWQLEGSDLIAALTLQKSRSNASTDTQSATSPQMNDLPLADLLSGAATVIMSRSLAAKVAPDGQ
ncbi:hypothetical protein ACXM5X_34900, partial [Pseudomonas saponiphila]